MRCFLLPPNRAERENAVLRHVTVLQLTPLGLRHIWTFIASAIQAANQIWREHHASDKQKQSKNQVDTEPASA